MRMSPSDQKFVDQILTIQRLVDQVSVKVIIRSNFLLLNIVVTKNIQH